MSLLNFRESIDALDDVEHLRHLVMTYWSAMHDQKRLADHFAHDDCGDCLEALGYGDVTLACDDGRRWTQSLADALETPVARAGAGS